MESQEASQSNPLTAQDERTRAEIIRVQASQSLFLRVAIVLIFLVGLNILIAWILQYYFNESILGATSFLSADGSWVPIDVHLGPVLGVHFFGDFEQFVGYARSSFSPFTSPDVLTSPYGPTAIVLVKVLDFVFGWPNEVFVFLIGSVSVLFVALVKIMRPSLESGLVALLLLTSAPVVVTLDRGNFQLLIAGLCSLFCVGLLKDKLMLTVIPVSFAIAIKAYVVLLVLVLVKRKQWRELGLISLNTVALYATCFKLVPGGYLSNIRGFIHTNLYFGSGRNSFISEVVSATGLIYKYLLLAWGPIHASNFYNGLSGWTIQIPGLIIVVFCLAVLVFAKGMPELDLVAVLAMIQLAPIGAFPYLELNIVIEVALILRLLSRSYTSRDTVFRDSSLFTGDGATAIYITKTERALLNISLYLLVIGVAPWVFRFGSLPTVATSTGPASNATAAWMVIGPTANIFCVACLLAITILSRDRRSSALDAALEPSMNSQ